MDYKEFDKLFIESKKILHGVHHNNENYSIYHAPQKIKVISKNKEFIFNIANDFYYCGGNIESTITFNYVDKYKNIIQFEKPNEATTSYSFLNIQLAVQRYNEKKWTFISGNFNVNLLNTKFATVEQGSR